MLRLLSVFVGPIFAKEMVEIARRKRYYLNRVFYGLALLVALFMVWESYRWDFRRPQGQSISLMARFAESMFQAVSGVQYGAVYLFVPLFLCGVVASEREERTLELLFTTQLTDGEIVLGKLGSRLAALGSLILFTLPIMSFIMLFGGVAPASLWRILAATALATLFVGAHAIYYSTITKSPMGALVRTYWLLAILLIGIPLAVLLPLQAVAPSPRHPLVQLYFAALLFCHPLASLMAGMDGYVYNSMVTLAGPWFFPLTFVIPTAWSSFLIWRSVQRLRLAPSPFGIWLKKVPWLGAFWRAWQAPAEFRSRRREPDREGTGFRRPVANPLWLRSRRAHVYDREGHIGRMQRAAWIVAAGFILLTALFEPRALDDEECSIAFHAPTWIAITALATIVAGISLVGDRRRGFLEQVLLTPLEPREMIDGTLLAIWEHLRRIYWLPWALGLFFCLTGASRPIGVLCSLITGTLFGVLLAYFGIACSLAARTVPGALVPTFLFPVVANLAVLFLMIFEEGSGPVLWIVTVLAFLGSRYWVQRRISAASVGCYFMAVYLGCASLFSCWTFDGRRDEWPIAAMHPGFLTMVTLDKRFEREFRDVPPQAVLASYWLALTITILWMRRWMIRHFEHLVERTDRPMTVADPAPTMLARIIRFRSRSVPLPGRVSIPPSSKEL